VRAGGRQRAGAKAWEERGFPLGGAAGIAQKRKNVAANSPETGAASTANVCGAYYALSRIGGRGGRLAWRGRCYLLFSGSVASAAGRRRDGGWAGPGRIAVEQVLAGVKTGVRAGGRAVLADRGVAGLSYAVIFAGWCILMRWLLARVSAYRDNGTPREGSPVNVFRQRVASLC